MNDSRLTNVNQLKLLLKGVRGLSLSLRTASIASKYRFIDKTINRLGYSKLGKRDKHIVRQYLKKFTGYKQAQLSRLIRQVKFGQLERRPYQRVKSHRIYSSADIKLLEKTDELHLRLSERATGEILRREAEVFNQVKYQVISKISHAHISNLRHHPIYQNSWINHTKARQVPIGVTMPPENYGQPGSIKVDTVHQRDVYHLNAVDEITQWEVVATVPQICEACMVPTLEEMLGQYPFVVFNFHSDRGGENINYQVADLLHRLLIKQTKTRARHPNDNALVETKNGAVVRKNMGWEHIHQGFCDDINHYYQTWFNPYLNFHRPCGFPTVEIDNQGRKHRLYDIYQVPYERLKSLPNAQKYLKPGISFKKLDTIAYAQSDNQFATILREEERRLFERIRARDHRNGLRRR